MRKVESLYKTTLSLINENFKLENLFVYQTEFIWIHQLIANITKRAIC